MSESEASLHPAELKWIGVRELTLRSSQRGSSDITLGEGTFNFQNGRTEYDQEHRAILVNLRVEIGGPEFTDEMPLHVIVEVVARFQIDESRIPAEKVLPWAEGIAPMILYPYVREHVFSLTSRAGFPSIILPLLQIPTMKEADLEYLQKSATSSSVL